MQQAPEGSLGGASTAGLLPELGKGSVQGWWALGCGSPGSQQHLTDGLFWTEVG